MMTKKSEEMKRDGRKAEYTDRPLTSEEKAFSADLKNYNQLFKYMRIHKLDQEEWYDILIIPYLQAVKKYLSISKLQQYNFGVILFKTLDNARGRHYIAMNRKKRKPDGGFVSLDSVIENDNGENRHMEAWFVDYKANTEKQAIFNQLFKEFYMQCITYDEPETWNCSIDDYRKMELDLLLEGYTARHINRETEKQYSYGYGVSDLKRDIEGFRRIFGQVFNS